MAMLGSKPNPQIFSSRRPPFVSSRHVAPLSKPSPPPRFLSTPALRLRGRSCAPFSSKIMSSLLSAPPETLQWIAPPPHPTYDLHQVIRLALQEDVGNLGDLTCLATIPSETQAEAQFLAKEDGVVAGIQLANMIFHEVDPSLKVEWVVQDGNLVRKGLLFGTVVGEARSILTAERVVLNFMQRMSGIATATKAMADAARPARILETRKTAPGLRLIDKWAVLIGGGENHRMGLFDMIMIKDNHVAVAGGIKEAIAAVNSYLIENNLDVAVEVETRTLDEVREVLACVTKGTGQVTRVMLDNMVVPLASGDVEVTMLQEAVKLINGKLETEASGNVTLQTVGKIGATGVTFISSGALTHSVRALDISLNVDTDLALAVGKRTSRA
ncbi:hypothetical protein O6H91_14G044300 [Diphasiastrum complanatum]|nr:hypothetical protein O6H91_14G044300 [Diphasiastrum complanatum]